ncbi:hypothetical protein [Streptomyces sp. NPDC058475]|uniref:hypothetical protein n=1 Tax=unclassified Streptomyces TaxID=2593676 RepID=UPI003666844C
MKTFAPGALRRGRSIEQIRGPAGPPDRPGIPYMTQDETRDSVLAGRPATVAPDGHPWPSP